MDQIELECPSCSTLLELDMGFAGGVCRCFNCGTLMTVPADPGRERAEALVRPDAPGGGRPEAPGMSDERPESPGGGRPEAPGSVEEEAEVVAEIDDESAATGIDLGSDELSAAGRDLAATTANLDVYVTASGRRVSLDAAVHIPTASKKRKRVKAAAIVLFVGLCLGTAAFLILIGYLLFGGDGGGDTGPTDVGPLVGIKATDNPFSNEGEFFLGVPLAKSNAVVIDGYDMTQTWKDDFRDYLRFVIDHQAQKTAFQFVFFTDTGVERFPDRWAAAFDQERKDTINRMIRGMLSINLGDPAAGMDTALQYKAEQIILVTSHRMLDAELDAISKKLGGADHLKHFSVVLIDEHSPRLKKLTSDHGGTYIKMTLEQLHEWREAANKPAGG